VIEGFLDDREQDRQIMLSGAWHIEALRRMQRLPRIETLLGLPIREQTDEEITQTMIAWVAEHNAKYEQRRRLGIAEVGE
jgi:hypothetical protein